MVLDGSGDVVLLNPDGSDRVTLTADAGTSVRYAQPVWSPEGAYVAWGESGVDGPAVGIAGVEGQAITRVGVGSFPFFVHWSPNGERVGYLHNSRSGDLAFGYAGVADGERTILGYGAPYYFSWSPDGDQVLVHVGGERISILDLEGGATDLGETSPNYLSPQWTETGIFYVGPDGVVIRPSEGEPRMLARADGFVSVVATPDGSRLAVQSIGPAPPGQSVAQTSVPAVARNSLSVLEVATGELTVASSDTALAFFWSPSGERLLMLIPISDAGDVMLKIWEDGELEELATLRLPPSLLRDALQFADQYAQSWRMWSPDSSAFVLPGRRDDVSGIWVFEVDGGEPRMVSDGYWAAWSG